MWFVVAAVALAAIYAVIIARQGKPGREAKRRAQRRRGYIA